eukprot:COSAG01_NODE_721_length_14068_cov_479.648436_5_plen_141_part_00
MAAVVSVNAIMSYFKDPSQVDWSDPAPWFSLLNMNVVGSLVFLALVALERINSENKNLLRKLDIVAVEMTRNSTVQQLVVERMEALSQTFSPTSKQAEPTAKLGSKEAEGKVSAVHLKPCVLLFDVQNIRTHVPLYKTIW